jgi:hypothetical protein
MLRDYDIFEKLPDGTVIWRACVFGKFDAERRAQELSKHSENEFTAIYIEPGTRSSQIVELGPKK